MVSGGGYDDNPNANPVVYATDQNQASLYADGPSFQNTFRIIEGVFTIPVAESPPEDLGELATWSPVAVIRLHSPYRIRRSAYITKKQTAPPVLPAPASAGAFEFIGGDVQIITSPNIANGNDWYAQTMYVHVENCVSRNVDGMVLGVPSFINPNQTDAVTAGTPSVPPYGAVYQAGDDAKRGYAAGVFLGDIVNQVNLFQFTPPYNNTSFYPGTLFNNELINASRTAVAAPPNSPGGST